MPLERTEDVLADAGAGERAGEGLRVALLGFGRLGRNVHAPVLSRLPGVSLVAVADESDEALEAASRRVPSAAFHRDVAEALDAVRPDAAVIALPPHLHATAAEACLGRGIAVYLEKPLADSLDAGRRVLDVWRASGTTAWMGFNFRFHPLARRLREDVSRGRLGHVVGVEAAFASAPRELPGWKRSAAGGGGVQLDLDSHHVDLARFLLGQEVVSVSAMVASVSTEADTSVMQLQMTGGTLVTSFSSLCAAERHTIEISGDAGHVRFDRHGSSSLRYAPVRRDASLPGRLRALAGEAGRFPRIARDALRPPRDPSYERALAAFFDAVRGGSAAGPDLTDGFESLRVVDAARRSAATGERVALAASGDVGGGPGGSVV